MYTFTQGRKKARKTETVKEDKGRHKEEKGTVHDWHPQLPRLGYQGVMATSAPLPIPGLPSRPHRVLLR